jgi:PAS domain S-box-containing protein
MVKSKYRAHRWTMLILASLVAVFVDLLLRPLVSLEMAWTTALIHVPVVVLAACLFRDDGARLKAKGVLDAVPNAIVSIDSGLRVTQWNPAAERMFGFPAQQVIGKSVERFVARHWLARHPLDRPLSAASASVVGADIVCLRADGRPFRAAFCSAPLRDERGRCVGATAVLRDEGKKHIDNRRIQRSLRGARDERDQADTSNRMKDELLATVSHELRTPLNAIYGWIEVLRHPSGKDMQSQAVDAIDRSARSLAHMVDDILDVSSLATGKLRLERILLDVERIVHDVTVTMQAMAAAEGVTLTSGVSATTGLLVGDGERLRQMLTNLVSNAIKFTPRGGHVKVTLEQDDRWLRLSVIDTGQGIAADFLPYVFDAFRRAPDAPVSPRRGLGLGLSIVRHIAELHGGSVEVASRGAGTGSRFTVRLPLEGHPPHAMPAQTAPLLAQPTTVLEGHRILLVDDDGPSRESLAAALRTLGATVREAGSGQEGLAAVREDTPTIVLSDLEMPDGDGFWLVRHINDERGTREPVPVLAVTAHADNAQRRQALAAGFRAYVAKPVDVRALARQILTLTTL